MAPPEAIVAAMSVPIVGAEETAVVPSPGADWMGTSVVAAPMAIRSGFGMPRDEGPRADGAAMSR